MPVDADIDSFGNKARALLDMGFEIGAVAPRIEADQSAFTQAELRQPVDQPLASLGLDTGQRSVGEFAAERPAAEAGEPSAFLVGKRNHVDPDASRGAAPRARQLKTKDDAERTIEPPAVRHAVAVRPDENALLRIRCAAVDRADSIDRRLETGRLHLVQKPAAGFEVGVAESRTADAGPLLAEFGQGAKVSENAILVDSQHSIVRPGTRRKRDDARFLCSE